jgi:NTE family protein
MKAYAVLSGGGVKGAALAGCLAAAEGRDIQWVGCAGTSAGALVAALASVGFRGAEIAERFKTDLHPRALIEDRGAQLDQLVRLRRRVRPLVSGNLVNRGRALLSLSRNAVLRAIGTYYGVYDGTFLERAIRSMLESGPLVAGKRSETFQDLIGASCPPLKVVASNITASRAVVFPDDEQMPVASAVRASMGYPFVYRPMRTARDELFVDGGVASNLPCFVFAKEHELTRHPILAFGLVAAPAAASPKYDALSYAEELLDTALAASDQLFVEIVPGVHYIQVPVPAGIGTFNIDVSSADIQAMFNAGYVAANHFFNTYEPLRRAAVAGHKLQLQLQNVYGDPKLFQPALWGLQQMIEQRTKAREVRVHLMLPTGRADRSRIVVYHFGFRAEDNDRDLELEEFGGCTGEANKNRVPAIADLVDAQKSYPRRWGMTQSQQARVAADRKSMLSVPLFRESASAPRDTWPVAGILSVDSSTPLAATGWVQEGAPSSNGPAVTTDVIDIVTGWATVCARLLR